MCVETLTYSLPKGNAMLTTTRQDEIQDLLTQIGSRADDALADLRQCETPEQFREWRRRWLDVAAHIYSDAECVEMLTELGSR